MLRRKVENIVDTNIKSKVTTQNALNDVKFILGNLTIIVLSIIYGKPNYTHKLMNFLISMLQLLPLYHIH